MPYPYKTILYNLKETPVNEIPFPLMDYGFLYGYGLFETVRVVNGKGILFNKHIQRLEYAAKVLEIPLPYELNEINDALTIFLKKNDISNAFLNIYLTPGEAKQDSTLIEFEEPTFLIVPRSSPFKKSPDEINLAVREESFKRTRIDQFKTMAYMKNILERRFAEPFHDVLLFNHDQLLLESSVSNVFFVKQGQIITPKSNVILQGVIRQFLLDNQVNLGISVEEKNIYVDELPFVDEIFLTNSLHGVILVKSVEGYSNLKSGPYSKQLKQACETALLRTV